MLHAAIASYPGYLQNPAKSSLPYIVDDTFETLSAELAGGPDKDVSLLVGPELPKAFEQYSKNFEHNRNAAMYVAHPQASMAQSHLQSMPVPYTRPEEVSYASGPVYSQRSVVEENNNTNYNANSGLQTRRIPEISSWSPRGGHAGTPITIYLLSAFELDPTWAFHATFAESQTQCSLTVMPQEGSYYSYMLTTEAPAFARTWTSLTVQLRVHAQDGMGNSVGSAVVGNFTYGDGILPPTSQMSPETMPRKRKLSVSSNESPHQRMKRIPSHDRESSFDQSQYSGYGQHDTTTYLQQPSMLAIDTSVANLVPEYAASNNPGPSAKQESPIHVSRHLYTSSTSSMGQMRRPSPVTPAWNSAAVPSSSSGGHGHSRNPTLSVTPSSRTIGSSPTAANPPLIRTSTIQQTPSPSATPAGTPAQGHFNPYAVYPHKAVLKINGDLDDMTKDWDEGELSRERRLVQFFRSQSGSTISTSFKPVAPEARQPNSICISCIWWEAKKEHYVTSVDTIYLLESLVAVRFTVEEKNRIRRNLEGFKPETVSKNKAISEDLFKLIMGFPAPKPRNIEKDVKVFPWKILAHALKKIIGKYSASYSSTQSSLQVAQPPPVNMYRTSQAPGGGLGHDYITPISPPQSSSSGGGVSHHSYHNSMPSTSSLNSVTLSPPPPPPASSSSSSSHGHLPGGGSYSTANSATMGVSAASQSSTYPIFSYPPQQHHHQHTTSSSSSIMSLMASSPSIPQQQRQQQPQQPQQQQQHSQGHQHHKSWDQPQPQQHHHHHNQYQGYMGGTVPTTVGPADHALGYAMESLSHHQGGGAAQYHLTHASSGA